MLYIVTFKTLPGTGISEECLISLKNPLQIQIFVNLHENEPQLRQRFSRLFFL